MPGILGGLFAIVCTGNAGTQILGIVINVVVAFVLGRVTGVIIGCLGRKEIPYSDKDEFIMDDDDIA